MDRDTREDMNTEDKINGGYRGNDKDAKGDMEDTQDKDTKRTLSTSNSD